MVVQKRNISIQQKAILLRKSSYTYKEIIEKLKVPKSTLSGWINTYISPEEEKKIRIITAQKGREKIIRLNKARSLKIKQEEKRQYQKYANQIKKIDKEALFWLGLGLYLAEGSKTDRWVATFYNSDPALNRIMIDFFRKICKVENKRIHIQLVLHENIYEMQAQKYWSKILNIPISNFYKASYVKSIASKGRRPKNRLPYGTLQLSISGKINANKMHGWMKGIKDQYMRE